MSRKVTKVIVDGVCVANREKGFVIRTYVSGDGANTKIESIYLFDENENILAILPIKDREFRFHTADEIKLKQSGVLVMRGDNPVVSGLVALKAYKGYFTEEKTGARIFVDGVSNGHGELICAVVDDIELKTGDVVKMYED